MRAIVKSGLAFLLLAGGCAETSSTQVSDYQTVDKMPRRDSDTATQDNEQALVSLAKGDLSAAEQSARAALAADVSFGPAHNTLGMVYYRESQLYLAAWEFQYAIKLMPSQPQGHNNLGLVYEAGGKWDLAVESYGESLKLAPEDEQIAGNLVRARLRRGDRDEEVRQLLNQIIAHDDRPEWVQWARQQLARLRPVATEPD